MNGEHPHADHAILPLHGVYTERGERVQGQDRLCGFLAKVVSIVGRWLHFARGFGQPVLSNAEGWSGC